MVWKGVGIVAMLVGNVIADDVVSPMPFALSPKLIEQARRAADAEAAKPRDLKQRRPRGLEQLETADEIALAVDRAMNQLAPTNHKESDLAFQQLSYLGDHAFSRVAAGATSANEDVATTCTWLLRSHGSRARPILEGNLKSPSKRVARAAVNSLYDMEDPGAIPALIEALDNEEIRHEVVSLLVRFHDARAIAPLQRLGETYRHDVESLQQKQRLTFKVCPVDQLERRQMCRNARCVVGETYGPQEIAQLVELLDLRFFDHLAPASVSALISLNERSAMPAAIQALRSFRQTESEIMESLRTGSRDMYVEGYSRLELLRTPKQFLFGFLAQVPTRESFEFLLEGIQSPDRSLRDSTIDAVRQVRWGIPLLIGLLDDPQYRVKPHTASGRYAETNWNLKMPASHGIYDKLYFSLMRFDLVGQGLRMTTARDEDQAKNFRIDTHISLLKTWWETNGDDFLQGKKVPNPNLIHVSDGLK
jgi:hypothetical protein